MKGQRIDGAFRQDKPGIRSPGLAVPKPFDATRRKAGKIPVLDFKAAQTFPVKMGKQCVASVIDAQAATKIWQAQDFGAETPACQ
jgi:hypothetical protein